jgi:hypothetical protein
MAAIDVAERSMDCADFTPKADSARIKNVGILAVCVTFTAFAVIEDPHAGSPDMVMHPGVTVIWVSDNA